MKIYKYPLKIVDQQYVTMPRGARVLSIGEQRGQMQMWALVDEIAQPVSRLVVIHGTGHPAGDVAGMEFIGTFMMDGGSLVFHAFVEPA